MGVLLLLGRPCADGAQSAGGPSGGALFRRNGGEADGGNFAAKDREGSEAGAAKAKHRRRPEAESTDYLGLLELPTLSLTLPVAAEWSYPALKRTPCRYSGTAGEVSFVIIAHNYPAHFGRLWELEPGAEVYFTDMAGTRTLYIVERQERLRPGDTEALSEPGLTLLTCTPGGRSRVAVRWPPCCTERAH